MAEEKKEETPETYEGIYDAGMTRRDHIAALAMQSVIASTNPESRINGEKMSVEAVRYADALIASLDKEPTAEG